MIKDRPISHTMMTCFLDCRMKFWKRYKKNIYWPDIENSGSNVDGVLFHRLSQSWFNQIDVELSGLPNEVLRWFDALKLRFPLNEGKDFIAECQVECEMTLTNGETQTMIVILDLIVKDETGITIVDFKTGQIKSDSLNERQSLQALMYLTVVAEVSGDLPLKMQFWSPTKGVISELNYDHSKHLENKDKLIKIIDSMKTFNISSFTRQDGKNSCKHCQYDKLCY